MGTGSENRFDIAIIGAGMAGAAVAYHLAPHAKVVIIEMEGQPGYHTTGRSAANFSEIYGPATMRALTSQSRDFFENPPESFGDTPLLSPRGILTFASKSQLHQLDQLFQTMGSLPGVRQVGQNEIAAMIPLLRDGVAVAGLLEERARDIDVNGLHRGFLRGLRQHGGVVLTGAEVLQIGRARDIWTLGTRVGMISARIVVNAAGAWADQIAALAGAAKVGLVPKRRTAVIVEAPGGIDVKNWPAVGDVDQTFYLKPDTGRFLMSPADETPSPPCDAQPDELDIATCIHRVEEAFDFKVRRVENSWAGLRSFVADQSPVCGFDPHLEGFFWLAGQGGFGIQSAPALSQLAAALITDSALPDGLSDRGFTPEDVSPFRFDAHM